MPAFDNLTSRGPAPVRPIDNGFRCVACGNVRLGGTSCPDCGDYPCRPRCVSWGGLDTSCCKPAHVATRPIDAPPSALTITTAHRTLLRRIIAGEPVGDLGHVLGSLYLHDLVDDDMANRLPFVTPLGLELLAQHDRLAATVKTERPRLESRPMPAPWIVDGYPGYLHPLGGRVSGSVVWKATLIPCGDGRAELRAMASAVISLLDWLDHEDAVRAQGGAS